RRRHTRFKCDWSSDVCSSDLITIRYSGHIAEWKTELVRNAAIKGILNQALEEKANLVNAAAIADSRGLRVHEARKAKSSMGGAEIGRASCRERGWRWEEEGRG